MFYYQHHIGDYLKHTAHLTPLEDITYRRLLDVYYDTESPIPIDIPLVSRRLRIDSATVKLVLDEYFQLTEDGYRNKRADLEIIAYHVFLQKQKTNGIKGGRPKTKPTVNPPISQEEPKITLTNNQQPITYNQNKTKKPSIPMPEGMNEAVWKDFLSTRVKAITQTGLNGIAKQARLAGITLEDALQECCTRGWQSFRADWINKPQQGTQSGKFNIHAYTRNELSKALEQGMAREVVDSGPAQEVFSDLPPKIHQRFP